MKIIHNPSNHTVRIRFRGTDYEIVPGGDLRDVSDELAEYWAGRTHKFLTVSVESGIPSPVVTDTASLPAEITSPSSGPVQKESRKKLTK